MSILEEYFYLYASDRVTLCIDNLLTSVWKEMPVATNVQKSGEKSLVWSASDLW